MKQVNNGFKEYYYLKEDGTILDTERNKIIKPDKTHMFNLKTENNDRRRIALKTLYKELYGKQFYIDHTENMENEEWKEIDDTEGEYLISNKGRVKSIKRYNAVILKAYDNQKGYKRIDIMMSGVRQSKLVHKLVAAAFIPLPKRIDMQLHHKDFNKENNAADNLEWLLPAEHAKKHSERSKELNECTESEKSLHREK